MRFNLTIRKKILLGLFFPTVCLAALAVVSYSNFRLIEERLAVLGRFDSIGQSLMDLRREGKIYLFYGDEASYRHTLAGVEATRKMLGEARPFLLFSGPQAMLAALLALLDEYADTLRRINEGRVEQEALLAAKSEAHRISMALEEDVFRLSGAVRERIGFGISTLRAQLAGAGLSLAALFALLWYFISARVLRPLREIEETTRQIARGNFTPVPLRPARDEIHDVQNAFNSMVTELERRQEQLVRSQKLSSIGTLSAGIAHQVNNPLNNISLLAQRLGAKLEPLRDQSVKKTLASMEDETARARDIVRGLLDFSRQSEFAPRLVPLRGVVESALRLAGAQTPPVLRLINNVPEEPKVYIDPTRMAEAFLNMIINAVQAIGEGPGAVRLFLSPQADPGRVELVIEDDGPGISEQDLPHIFDPFFTRKEIGRGTGLGLAIAYGIIQEGEGKVRVESEPGQGARFFISLPLAPAACAVKGACRG